MNTDNRLSRALEDLSDVPGPASLADKALRQAKSRHIKGYAAGTTAAFAAAALIAAPFLFAPSGGQTPGGGQFAAPPSASASAGPSSRPCDEAPWVQPKVKQVAGENWPGYVKTAVERLPARTDYVMQSGTMGVCEGEAYSVVNLGPLREQGHLTVLLSTTPPDGSAGNCAQAAINPAQVAGPGSFRLLFCDEGNGFKLVYGIDDGYSNYRVYAVYADGRTVAMESLGRGGGAQPVVSAQELRTVVTDPAMLTFFG